MGDSRWLRGVHLRPGLVPGATPTPASPVKGDKVIFHKHYRICFVGDKVFAKLCWKSRTFHMIPLGRLPAQTGCRGLQPGLPKIQEPANGII